MVNRTPSMLAAVVQPPMTCAGIVAEAKLITGPAHEGFGIMKRARKPGEKYELQQKIAAFVINILNATSR